MCFISLHYCSLPLNDKMNILVEVNICIVLLHVFILANLTTAIGKYKNNQNYIKNCILKFSTFPINLFAHIL